MIGVTSGQGAGADTVIVSRAAVDRAAPRQRRHRRRRRAVRVAGAAAVMAAAGLALTTCSNDRHAGHDAAVAASRPAGGTTQTPCSVRYLTRDAAAGRFDVDLTVTNNTAQPLVGWTLRFAFAGDQTIRGSSAGVWTQGQTGLVTVRNAADGAPLASRGSTTMSFSAEYRTANPMPSGFTLNDATCSYVLVDAAGRVQTGGPQPNASPPSPGPPEAAGTVGPGAGQQNSAGGDQGNSPGGNAAAGNAADGGGSTGGGSQGTGTSGGGPAPAPAPTTPGPGNTTSQSTPKPTPSSTGICVLIICVGLP